MDVTRRRFLRTLGALGAGIATGAIAPGCGGRHAIDPRERTARRVLADLHGHAALDDWNEITPFARRYPVLVDAITPFANKSKVDWPECFDAGVDLVCVVHYNVFDEVMSVPVDPDPGSARRTHAMIDRFEHQLTGDLRPFVRLARGPRELRQILSVDKQTDAWRIAAVHSLEGAHALGGDLANIAAFAKRGVAYMTITHFSDKGVGSTANALPYFPDMGADAPALGLHGFGRELVAEMERVGMLVDITHGTSTMIDDVLAETTHPVIASHASARALGDHPYSLTDEHAQEITKRGGVIGVLLYPLLLSNYSGPAEAQRWGSLRDTVRTVRHLVKVCGSHQAIAIGSDFGAYISPPKEMERLSEIAILRDMLLDEFSDDALVEDVLANNAIRFLTEHWRRDA